MAPECGDGKLFARYTYRESSMVTAHTGLERSMSERAWQLPLATGQETTHWVVVDVLEGDDDPTLVCNVALAGQIYSVALASNDDRAPWGFRLA